MADGYASASLRDLETNPEKPGRRWEVSPALGIDGFNFNVALLEPGTPLSQNEYHRHENQAEFFYVVSGRCRVEVEDESFDLSADEVVYFERGVPHLLHNPFDEPCKLVAIGHPPEGRYPVEQLRSYESLLAERGRDAASNLAFGSAVEGAIEPEPESEPGADG